MKKIRRKQLKPKKFALNKDEKTIGFKPKNEICPLDGIGLRNYIDKCIGSNYLKYVKNKLKCLSVFEKEGRNKLWDCTVGNQ